MISRDLTKNKQTDEALRESEDCFRSVFDLAPVGIVLANKQGILIQTNQAFQEILGYTAEELQNLSFIELTHPDGQEENIKLFQELLAGKRSHFSLEKRYFRKDGCLVWVNVSVSAVCDANGLPLYAFAMIQEISAQKQAQLDLQKAHEQLEKRVTERTAELEQANTLLRQEIANRQQAQETLQESHEFLQTVLDTNPNMTFVKDREGRVILANQAYADFRGTIVEDLLGKTDADFNPNQAEVEQFRREDQEIFTTLQPKFIPEETCRTKTGEMRWYQIIKKPLFSSDGQVYGVLGVCTDITERKLLTEELKAQKDFLQTVIDTNPNKIFVKDKEGKYVLANQACADFYGMTLEQVLGKTDHQLNHNPGNIELFIAQDREVLATLQQIFIPENACRSATGEVRWYQVIKKPLLSTDGQVYQVFGVCTDITERKLAEEALRESEQRYRLLIEGMNDGVIVLDENSSISYVNEKLCEMLGYLPSEMIGHPICEFVDETYLQIVQEQTLRRRRGESGSYELGLKRKDGQTLLTLASGTPIIGTEGSLEGSFGVITNITALKAVESELQLAHEQLRAVLDAVPGFVSWISSEGRYLGVNQHLAKSFNLSPDTFVGKELGFLKHSCEFVQFMKQFLATPAQTDRQVIETQINGSTRNYLIAGQKYNQGSMAVSVGIDITERKQALEALKAQKELLQTVLDTNPNAIFVKDREGKYLLSNQAFADIHGITVEEVLGLKDADLHPHQADTKRFIAQDFEVFATLEQKFIPEEAYHTPTGEVRWFQTIKSPIFSSDGQVYGVFGVSTDITERKRAQEALKTQKEFLQTILDTNPNMIYVKDREGRYVLVNQAFADFYGITVDQALGLKDADFNPNQADRERYIAQDFEVFTTLGQKFIPEEACHTPTGEVRWLQTTKKRLVSSDGQVYQLLGVSTDITQHKLALEALHRSEARFRLAIDNIPNVFAIYDAQRRFQYVNAEGRRRSGKSLEEHLGYTDEEIWPNEVTDKYLPILKRAVETRTIQIEECTISVPNTATFTIVVTYVPLLDEGGKVYQILGITHDITARKQAEEQLRSREEQLRLALDAARMGNWDWNLQTGNIIWSNHLEQLFGLAPNTFKGTYEAFLARIHLEDRDSLRDSFASRVYSCTRCCIEKGENCDIEFRVVLPDGSIRWMEDKGQVIYDETGMPVRMIGVSLDISDRKQAEARIRESLREKEVLLQEIHHRVKNNLQVISSLLDLQSQYIDERSTQEVFRESCNRVKSMALVHEKLYESKDCAKINFAEYIETLISYLFQVYAGRSENIALELDIDELFLNIDTAIPCGLIISELVSNALKYAFPNNNAGVIHVELYPEIDNYLTLLVKDNGIGLPINFDIKSVKSLGLQLVNVLTTQLEGTLEINHCVGTEFQIKFSQSSC